MLSFPGSCGFREEVHGPRRTSYSSRCALELQLLTTTRRGTPADSAARNRFSVPSASGRYACECGVPASVLRGPHKEKSEELSHTREGHKVILDMGRQH